MATVYGNDNSETITWWSGVTNSADLIYGFGGNDKIYGLGGNDTIKGGGGADAINGGSGTDTVSYLDSTVGVTVNLANGTGFGGTAEGDTFTEVEDVIGSQQADTLIGNDGANKLIGADGDDLLKGGGGADQLFGDAGADTLKGGGGADTLNGGSGIDTASYTESGAGVFVSLITDSAAYGDAEGDNLNDIENLTGSAYHDDLWGDNGANVLSGMNGADTLKGYGGNDTLLGGSGNDTLYGMDGDDKLIGGAGNDTMAGGANNDRYYVDSAADVVTEVAGQGTNDIVFSNIASYTLAANVEILSLADSLVGINGTGNALNNTIFGNANNNVLNGGAGSDSLSGLGGNDTFVFAAGQAHGDTVYEFNGNGAAAGDVLRFEGYGTIAQGATFRQLSATQWQATSADGTMQETITFAGGYTFDTTTDLLFV